MKSLSLKKGQKYFLYESPTHSRPVPQNVRPPPLPKKAKRAEGVLAYVVTTQKAA